jgi:hypothetical protein
MPCEYLEINLCKGWAILQLYCNSLLQSWKMTTFEVALAYGMMPYNKMKTHCVTQLP